MIEEKIPETKKQKRFHPFHIIVFVVVVTSLSFGGYFYYKYRKLQNSPNAAIQKEAKDLLAKVAQIYIIPTGEEPTIATVSDPTALKNQSFFLSSQKGDKVLIFSQAGKAILYRPSVSKIVEIAPINKNDQTTKVPEKTSESLKDKTF